MAGFTGVQQFVRGLIDGRPFGTVTPQMFGAKGDGVADDTAAFVAAFAVSAHVFAPQGTYRVSGLDFAGKSIRGAGRFLTILEGAGDLLTNATACGLSDLTIRNVGGNGKLVSITTPVDAGTLGRSFFQRVEFGAATHHTYLDASANGVTDWVFENCRFMGATVLSRYFYNCWALKERGCYTSYNQAGLRIEGGSSLQVTDSVFEYNNAQGVILDATNNSIVQSRFAGVHFESNGNTDGTEQVFLGTSAAVRVSSVSFDGCAFYAPHATYNVAVGAGGGGNVSGVSFRNCFGGPLIPPGALATPPVFDGCDLNGGALPADAVNLAGAAQLQHDATFAALQADALRFSGMGQILGMAFGVGPEAGNGAVQYSVAPPAGAMAALILVQGDIYAGASGSNNASWFGWWQSTSNRIFAIAATDSTLGGAAQGFDVTFTAGEIQVANKAGMSATQNGRVTILFLGV